jgi:transposase InsO family protein
MRQRRWLELIKDYDLEIHYHLGKANVVANALGRKVSCHCHSTRASDTTLCQKMEKLNLGMIQHETLTQLKLELVLLQRIIDAQRIDKGMKHIHEKLKAGKANCFRKDDQGIIWFNDCIVVSKDAEIRQQILDEAHLSRYSIHPGSTKMYQDLKQHYWWTKMKIEIARYVARCDTCRRVMAVHMKTAGPLQSLPISAWKWEDISMDFIVGLPKTTKGFDSIWVIIDQFTKIAHFLPVKTKNPVVTYVKLYIARILSLHGIPKTIVSDRGPQFVSKFWSELHIFLGTKLLHSSTYHPQTSGQTKRVNQILEDMLRSCVMEFPQKWDDCLPLAEFSYNNNYQESIKMAPFEALHGQRCRTPLNWSEPGDRWYFRPDLVKETEAKVQQIRHHLKEAQARQKSYVDK